MSDLSLLQLILIGLTFVWSGFVRSGLGFGGAALALPLMLLIENNPLLFLPLIAVHLVVFSTLIIVSSHLASKKKNHTETTQSGSINWQYLKQSMWVIIIPKLLGVYGLLLLPPELMTGIIFVIILAYSLSYILDKPFKSNRPWVDKLFLVLGGYTSGTSLTGAPLIIAVYSGQVERHQLRDTLFVLWLILVAIKLASFLALGVDMQWIHHLWLLPCVAIGHFAGLKLHQRLQEARSVTFYRVLGVVLLIVSVIGLARALFAS